MQRPPRSPRARLMGRREIARSLSEGLAVFAVVAMGFWMGLQKHGGTTDARTLAFSGLLLGNLGLIVAHRAHASGLLHSSGPESRVLGGAVRSERSARRRAPAPTASPDLPVRIAAPRRPGDSRRPHAAVLALVSPAGSELPLRAAVPNPVESASPAGACGARCGHETVCARPPPREAGRRGRVPVPTAAANPRASRAARRDGASPPESARRLAISGSRDSTLRRPARVRSTHWDRRSSDIARRRTRPSRSSERRTPVMLGGVVPARSASWAGVSPCSASSSCAST